MTAYPIQHGPARWLGHEMRPSDLTETPGRADGRVNPCNQQRGATHHRRSAARRHNGCERLFSLGARARTVVARLVRSGSEFIVARLAWGATAALMLRRMATLGIGGVVGGLEAVSQSFADRSFLRRLMITLAAFERGAFVSCPRPHAWRNLGPVRDRTIAGGLPAVISLGAAVGRCRRALLRGARVLPAAW